jgi:hypothetical protein
MLTRLAVPFADTSASALQWSMSPPDCEVLDTLVLSVPGGGWTAPHLELGVLGSSHCAVLRARPVVGDGAAPLVETVSCRSDDAGEPVPALRERRVGRLYYHFASEVDELEPAELPDLAPRLRSGVRNKTDHIAGVFPGTPGALTLLKGQLTATSARWFTWHLYPNTGEVVRTRTMVQW